MGNLTGNGGGEAGNAELHVKCFVTAGMAGTLWQGCRCSRATSTTICWREDRCSSSRVLATLRSRSFKASPHPAYLSHARTPPRLPLQTSLPATCPHARMQSTHRRCAIRNVVVQQRPDGQRAPVRNDAKRLGAHAERRKRAECRRLDVHDAQWCQRLRWGSAPSSGWGD